MTKKLDTAAIRGAIEKEFERALDAIDRLLYTCTSEVLEALFEYYAPHTSNRKNVSDTGIRIGPLVRARIKRALHERPGDE